MRKPASFYFFRRKSIVQKDRHKSCRAVGNLLGFNAHKRVRVEWMVFHYTVDEMNATLTA